MRVALTGSRAPATAPAAVRSRAVERATSTRDLRRASTAAVLETFWHVPGGGPVTGSDLILTTGLTRATVHDVCADLITTGWLTELDDQRTHGSYSRGRPARRYGLRARAGVVVGVEASSIRCTAVATDLLGVELARASVGAPPDPAERRAAALDAVGRALEATGATAAELLACTVGVPAPVSAAGLMEVTSNTYWVLMDAGIAEHLRERLGCPVSLANDADLAAMAEGRCGAAAGCTDHVTLLADGGFGAGMVADGALVRGRWGRGGEMRWLDLVTDVGAPVGLGPLLAHWSVAGAQAPPPPDPPMALGITVLEASLARAEEVLDAAARDEPAARAVVDRAGHHVARVVATVGGLLDPEVVVLAGRLAAHLGPLLDVVDAVMPGLLDAPVPRVVASGLGPDVVALGAAQQALDGVRSRALEITLPGRA